MSAAKIQLSKEEKELIQNAQIILTKNRLLEAIQSLFAGLQPFQQQKLFAQQQLAGRFSAWTSSSPKISKGENYRGLPYIVLDYPRHFSMDDFMMIRTMFWWGNYFSITLHAAGAYKDQIQERLLEKLLSPVGKSYFIYRNHDPWQHHFEEGNYTQVANVDPTGLQQIIDEKNFIKLAKKIPLQDWDTAGEQLLSYFDDLLSLLS